MKPLIPLIPLALLFACESAPRTPPGGGPAAEGVPATAHVGRLAPDVELAWLNREDASDSLADLRGRVVLLEFWRTW